MIGNTIEWFKNHGDKGKFKYTEADNIKYPSKETIISMHDFFIEIFLKKGESCNHGFYDSVDLSFKDIKYICPHKETKEETIIYKGAMIFNRFLEAGHPFVDGNKRTGFVTLWMYLLINGYELKSFINYNKHYALIEKWASMNDGDNISEIALWIKNNSKKYNLLNK